MFGSACEGGHKTFWVKVVLETKPPCIYSVFWLRSPIAYGRRNGDGNHKEVGHQQYLTSMYMCTK